MNLHVFLASSQLDHLLLQTLDNPLLGGQFGTETGQHVILESQANLKLGDPLLQTHTDTPSPNRKSSVNTRRRRSSTAATCSAV